MTVSCECKELWPLPCAAPKYEPINCAGQKCDYLKYVREVEDGAIKEIRYIYGALIMSAWTDVVCLPQHGHKAPVVTGILQGLSQAMFVQHSE